MKTAIRWCIFGALGVMIALPIFAIAAPTSPVGGPVQIRKLLINSSATNKQPTEWNFPTGTTITGDRLNVGGGVATSRSILTTSPLSGGGTLAADLTLTCPTCVTTARSIFTSAPLSGGGALSGDLTLTCGGCVMNARQVIAGAGLAGGGNLAANITLSMPNLGPGAVTSGGGGTVITSITTDAQGRIASLTAAAPAAGTPTGVTQTTGGLMITNTDTTPSNTEITDGINFRLGGGTTPDWRGTRGWHWLYSTGSTEYIAMELGAPQNSSSGAYLRFPKLGGGIHGELTVGTDTSGGTHDVFRINSGFVPVFANSYGIGDQDTSWGFTVINHPGYTGTPSVAAGPAAGTGSTIGVTGADADFEVTLTTGTAPATTAVLFTVTFNSAWSHASQGGWNRAPKCVFSPTSSNAGNIATIGVYPYVSSVSTTQLVFTTIATMAVSQPGYSWAFHCAN